jgi:hypothetical protein
MYLKDLESYMRKKYVKTPQKNIYKKGFADMVMRWKISVALVVVILALQLASASVVAGNSSIQSNYQSGEDISGWIEIQFDNHSLDGLMEDSFENSINIEDLLDANPEYNYSINESSNTVTSLSLQKIYFNNLSFSVPSSELNYTYSYNYSINIDGNVILSKTINISNEGTRVAEEIEEKKQSIDKIKSQIENYSIFLRSSLNLALDISLIEGNLSEIGEEYNSSSANYSSLLERLDSMKIPEFITEVESAKEVSFVPYKDGINLAFLEEIGGGNYSISLENSYKERIIFWNQENLNPKITFKKINAIYDGKEENALSYVEISVNQRPQSEVFFIIENIDNLIFDKNYGLTEKDDYLYLDFSKAGERVVFSTTEDLKFDSLPFFISPPLTEIPASDLNQDIIDSDEESKFSKWILFVLIIILLIIIFIVAYIMLKAWYDKKYENYLFKDKNQLYNLIHYITASKKKGMKNDEIEKTLRKSKWTNEQIRFIMRKYAGKRTGMWGWGTNKSDSKNI